MPSTLTSRIFMNGNSQALRIPQAFRLEAQRVAITRTDDGSLLVRPLPDTPQERADALLRALQGFDELGGELDAFVALLEDDRRNQPPAQERDAF